MKKRLLVFCDFYLPGYKSGGGMWTVVNLVEHFADEYDFFIVTRNYESKGDRTPYTSVRSSEWNEVRGAKVFYLDKADYSLRRIASIVGDVDPAAVFLNSALSTPVLRFLSVRRKQMIKAVPVIVAPCGEMTAGALSVKPLKKKLFFAYAKAVGLYRDVIWKASSSAEKLDIEKLIGSGLDIRIASDLAPLTILPEYDLSAKPAKFRGSARFMMLARITGMKNIHYFIERLAEIAEGEIILDLCGPVEDENYWLRCREAMSRCGPDVTVNAHADFLPRDEALQRMIASHFFVLPTLGENFGYVFLEAMAAGCPLLLSDRTTWKELGLRNAGWEIPLDTPVEWCEQISRCVQMDADEFRLMSANARSYALEWLASGEAVAANRAILAAATASDTARQ